MLFHRKRYGSDSKVAAFWVPKRLFLTLFYGLLGALFIKFYCTQCCRFSVKCCWQCSCVCTLISAYLRTKYFIFKITQFWSVCVFQIVRVYKEIAAKWKSFFAAIFMLVAVHVIVPAYRFYHIYLVCPIQGTSPALGLWPHGQTCPADKPTYSW